MKMISLTKVDQKHPDTAIFFKEMKQFQNLNCDFIITLFDHFFDDNIFGFGYLITEYCQVYLKTMLLILILYFYPPENKSKLLI